MKMGSGLHPVKGKDGLSLPRESCLKAAQPREMYLFLLPQREVNNPSKGTWTQRINEVSSPNT